jgi:hypothetical protein
MVHQEVATKSLVCPIQLTGMQSLHGDAVSSDSVIVVKHLNKKQLQQRLDCNTEKLKCAEKKVMATQEKLLTTKEHCKQLASLAQERQKDSRLAYPNAKRKDSAIRAELDNAQGESTISLQMCMIE